jgi:predicted Ser/Thr protein kinase
MQCALCSTPLPDQSRYCFACGADVSGDLAERTLQIDRDPELETMLQEDLRGDYIVEQLLERGGMAAVFLARDANLGRKVAIKVLPPELTYGHGMVARFKSEARTAATLDHPHIVPIYRISTGGRLFWYVMKYIEGESLGQVLEREGALPPARAANVLGQVAEALDFAHKKGVVHRDIKPDNIMIDPRGWITVMDFGIAKAIDRPGVTGPGSTLGTPYYMSPEQCVGGFVTPAADQYSLGIVAYRMLTDQLPFRGDSVIAVVRAQTSDPIPPLPDSVPAPLAAVVQRALAKKPQDRFPDVLAFADAFAHAARRDPSSLPPDVRRRAQARARPGARTPIGMRSVRGGAASWLTGHPWLARGAGTLGLVGAVVLSASVLKPHAKAVATPRDTVPSEAAAMPLRVGSSPPAAEAKAYLTVGSVPFAAITINGRPTPGNPVASFPVRPGQVRLHFQVRDSSGAWAFDTALMLAAGERRNVGRLHLVRPRS